MLHIALAALVVSQAPAAPPAAPPAAETPATPAESAPAAPAAPAAEAAPPATPAPATPEAPAASALPAPTKPRLLVMDLVDKGAGPDVTNAINQAVQGQAVQSHLGETVTATQVKIALDAAANQAMVGCESEACMTDIGKTVEASIILGGSVAKVGEDFLITLLAVNPRDGSRIAQQQRKVPGNRELYYYAARQLASIVLTGRSVDPRVPVQIAVQADDGEGTIIVDGKEVGTGGTLTVQLDPGSHEIRVKKGGKSDWKTVIQVEEATPMQVTADLVDDRLQLWPIAIGTGAASVVTLGVALGFGVAAADDFNGAFGVFNTPENSYSFKEPVDSEELFTIEQRVKANAAIANGFYVTSAILGAATVALVATDFVLAGSAE